MATLTPVELATLLGPQLVSEIQLAAEVRGEPNRWNGFAERFAKLLTSRLRPLTRSAVRVQPFGAATICAESILGTSSQPAIADVWESPYSDELLAVTLSLPLVTVFVDHLLGGGLGSSSDGSLDSRALSETDRQLASRLLGAIELCFVEAGRSNVESLPLGRTSMRLLEAWLPDCELVRLSFEIRFVNGTGMFDLLLPVEFANLLADKSSEVEAPRPSSQSAFSTTKLPATQAENARLTNGSSPRSSISVRLAQTSLSANDLNRLAVGDVVFTATNVGEPCEVLIDGAPAFLAVPGQLDGHKAVRLLQAIND